MTNRTLRFLRLTLTSVALAFLTLGTVSAQISPLPEQLLDPEIVKQMDADELLGYIDRAKVAIQSLSDGNRELERRIEAMERELAQPPATIDGLTEKQAQERIGELSSHRAGQLRELALRTQGFTPLIERLNHAAKQDLERLAGVELPADMVAKAYGTLSKQPPVHFNCEEERSSITRVVCRNDDLAALDRRLAEVTRDAHQKASSIDRAFLERAHAEFISSLSSCAGSVASIITEPKRVETARVCAAQRYRARIESLGGSAAVETADSTSSKRIKIGETWYSDSTVNLRAGPSTRTQVLDKISPCTSIYVISQIDGTPWYEVRVDGREGFMHEVTLAKTKPSSCEIASAPSTGSGSSSNSSTDMLEGRVTRVLTVSRVRIEGKLVNIAHVVDRGDPEQVANMRRFLDLFGQRLRCKPVPRTDGWVCAGQTQQGEIVDIGKAAIFNGAACPGPDAPSDYREAYKKSRARGNQLVCQQ